MLTKDEFIIKDFCYYLTPEYAETFWGKYIWLYQGKGELRLSMGSLLFSGKSYSVSIPLENITSIETKAFSRFAKPFGLAMIIIKYVEDGTESTIQFVPMKSPFKPTWETDKLIERWVEEFEAVPEISDHIKRPLEIPAPPSKTHLMILKSAVGLYFLLVVSFLLWAASMWITIDKDYYKVPVLEEKESIQNPSSKILQTLLTTGDFPDEWQWVSVKTQQPGKFSWQEEAVESANMNMGAKVPQYFIFRHYVYVIQFAASYSLPITSEARFNDLALVSDEDETSFIPELNKPGRYNHALCSKGSDSYHCEVSIGYDYAVYTFLTITPESFGEQFTIDFLNSIIDVTDRRVKQNLK